MRHLAAALLCLLPSWPTVAIEPPDCRIVRLADIGTDVTATTALAARVIEGLDPLRMLANVTGTFAERFGRRIYGIEPGNDSNRIVSTMIERKCLRVGVWRLMESSEQGMLTQVARAITAQE